jgi:hypothetical protein
LEEINPEYSQNVDSVLAITLEDLRETKEDEIREMKKYGIRT